MKKTLAMILMALLCVTGRPQGAAEPVVHTEVMAWSNITGVRLDGELIDFESALCVGVPGGKMERTGRERQQNVRYRREGLTQIVDIPLHGAHFRQEVTDTEAGDVRVKLLVEADATLAEGAYFSLTFTPKYYAGAKFKTSARQVRVIAPERPRRSVDSAARRELRHRAVLINAWAVRTGNKELNNVRLISFHSTTNETNHTDSPLHPTDGRNSSNLNNSLLYKN